MNLLNRRTRCKLSLSLRGVQSPTWQSASPAVLGTAPPPEGAKKERIATAYGLAMTVVVGRWCFCFGRAVIALPVNVRYPLCANRGSAKSFLCHCEEGKARRGNPHPLRCFAPLRPPRGRKKNGLPEGELPEGQDRPPWDVGLRPRNDSGSRYIPHHTSR